MIVVLYIQLYNWLSALKLASYALLGINTIDNLVAEQWHHNLVLVAFYQLEGAFKLLQFHGILLHTALGSEELWCSVQLAIRLQVYITPVPLWLYALRHEHMTVKLLQPTINHHNIVIILKLLPIYPHKSIYRVLKCLNKAIVIGEPLLELRLLISHMFYLSNETY